MDKPLTILLTALGVPATRGTLYMLRHGSNQVKVVGVDAQADLVASHWVERFYQVPLRKDPKWLNKMMRICQEEKVDLIFAQTDDDALLLATHHSQFEKIGTKIAVAKTDTIHRAWNKGLLLELFRNAKLPTPDFVTISHPEEIEKAAYALGYPDRDLVLKPAQRSGGRGFHLLTSQPIDRQTFFQESASLAVRISLESLLEVTANFSDMPPLLLMEYLPGVEYSVDGFRGEKAEVAIARERQAFFGGVSFKTTLEYRQDLIDLTCKAAKLLGLRFAYGMQYKCNREGVPMILECNPRIHGTMVASFFSGVNLLEMAVNEALGHPPAQPTPPFKRASFARFWGGVAVGEEGVFEI